MKKFLLFIFVLLIIAILFVIAKEPAVIEEVTDRVAGDISYKEIRDKELLGYEPVYKQEEYSVEVCESPIDNDSESPTFGENVTTCRNEVRYRTVIDDSKQGDPIYKYSDIKALEYNGKRTDFIGKGCFICESVKFEGSETVYSGRLMLCLSDRDGYKPNVKECWIESGASYIINDLDSGELLYSHLDIGARIG